jgi:hypothetical protein
MATTEDVRMELVDLMQAVMEWDPTLAQTMHRGIARMNDGQVRMALVDVTKDLRERAEKRELGKR